MYQVVKVERQNWLSVFHEKSFTRVFGESTPVEKDRSDFALVVMKNDVPFGFVTCMEMDADHLYWQLGGASDDFKKTYSVLKGYEKFFEWCADKYESISTRILNTNTAMIKMALHCGFVIIGTRAIDSEIYLELIKEF